RTSSPPSTRTATPTPSTTWTTSSMLWLKLTVPTLEPRVAQPKATLASLPPVGPNLAGAFWSPSHPCGTHTETADDLEHTAGGLARFISSRLRSLGPPDSSIVEMSSRLPVARSGAQCQG